MRATAALASYSGGLTWVVDGDADLRIEVFANYEATSRDAARALAQLDLDHFSGGQQAITVATAPNTWDGYAVGQQKTVDGADRIVESLAGSIDDPTGKLLVVPEFGELDVA